MDLKVHKAILYNAMIKSGREEMISSDFLAIWAGNWMTDINQASCVLDMLPEKAVKGLFKNKADYRRFVKMKKEKISPYNAFVSNESTEYALNPLLKAIEENWTNLIKELWEAEIKSTTNDYHLTGNTTENITTFDLQKIGMYYPLDHFDVVGSKDITEISDITDRFTRTAVNGIFEHACNRLLKKAFDLRPDDKKASLFYLGRALHVLSDFYAHSNFVYLTLRCFAERDAKYNSIESYFAGSWEHILFKKFGSSDAIPVMTGRFDKIDTIASILKTYKSFIIPDFNDFKEDIIKIDENKPQNDRLSLINFKIKQNETILALNILFGTFSNIKFTHELQGIAIFTVKVVDFLKRLTGEIKNEFLDLIDNIVEQELKTTDSEHLVDFVKELKSYSPDDAKSELKNHLKAGKLMYYEYMIQKTIIDNLFEHNTEYLPHHTLIANDSDNSHPVRRLEYKMACYFAHAVSRDIIHLYYNNGSMEDARRILDNYYFYPKTFYEANEVSIMKAINEMYGCRWWEYIQN